MERKDFISKQKQTENNNKNKKDKSYVYFELNIVQNNLHYGKPEKKTVGGMIERK